MDTIELLNIISTGETSTVQFKEDMPHRDSLMKEMVAMSNSIGGVILIGVKDVTGELVGLNAEQVEQYDKEVSQIADLIEPSVYILTEVVKKSVNPTESKDAAQNILVIHIEEGVNKPYKTDKGEIYAKQGANKRLIKDNAEIMRLFQRSGNLLADEMEVYGTSIQDVNVPEFEEYFRREFNMSYEEAGLTLEQALKAKRALRNDKLTLAGLLFFGKNPQSFKPAFTVKLVSYWGNDPAGTHYRSKPDDLKGTIPDLFKKVMDWLKTNLHCIQTTQEFNTIGQLEVSEIALMELIVNALVHRDYFKNSPIRIMVFDNRVEIISPGSLPNTLTVEDIKYGNPIIRNNQLVSLSTHCLPFSGLGTGIKRAIKEQPNIEFENDVAGEQFKVTIPRPVL
ncbi:MAG: putative DNA binding domain-containing protein [Bacteroidales bacterium]|nr:putative DNA binding domain-containing protein [Bacteroidales bacterium]